MRKPARSVITDPSTFVVGGFQLTMTVVPLPVGVGFVGGAGAGAFAIVKVAVSVWVAFFAVTTCLPAALVLVSHRFASEESAASFASTKGAVCSVLQRASRHSVHGAP